MISRRHRKQLVPYLFLLPGMLFLLAWLAYPMLQAFLISLHNWKLMPGQISPFIGLDNYLKAANDPLFWVAMKDTALYALVTVIGQLLLGILVALLVDRVARGRVFFRVVYYLPVVTSLVVVSLLFKYLFNSSPAGLINYVLVNIFHIISEPVPWLNQADSAWIAIYSLGIWKGVGWTMVIVLAALQAMPEECVSAAAIDGANDWQTLIHITLPLLMPTIILIFIMLTIGAFQVYTPVALITAGGPLHRTEVLLTYMYGRAFTDLDYGYSTAISYVLAVIVFVISQIQLRLKGPSALNA